MSIFREGGGRCYDPITTLAITAGVIGAGSSIYGGVSANSASKQEAKLQEQQGQLAYEESQTAATDEAFNQNQQVGRQKLAFLSNGVSLEGSPAMVLAESKKYGQSRVDSILRRGTAQYNLAQSEAQITRNKGRTALIGGILTGVGTLAATGVAAGKAGMFDPATKVGAGPEGLIG